jgi:hypothetical protein
MLRGFVCLKVIAAVAEGVDIADSRMIVHGYFPSTEENIQLSKLHAEELNIIQHAGSFSKLLNTLNQYEAISRNYHTNTQYSSFSQISTNNTTYFKPTLDTIDK